MSLSDIAELTNQLRVTLGAKSFSQPKLDLEHTYVKTFKTTFFLADYTRAYISMTYFNNKLINAFAYIDHDHPYQYTCLKPNRMLADFWSRTKKVRFYNMVLPGVFMDLLQPDPLAV